MVENMKNRSFNELEALASQNNQDAYYYLGNCYYFGTSEIEKDYKKAYEYFNKSIECEKKIYASKFNLGEMYLQGLYVNKDIEQAVKYFEDILTEEYDDAYYKLAEIYEGKYGEIKDEEKARKYYNKIEIDLCSSLLLYCIAIEGAYYGDEKLDENVKEYWNIINSDILEIEKVYKILCNYMPLTKLMIEQFKKEHPAAILHDRLNCLYSYEYDNIVERLKNKISKCINETNFCKLTKTFDCKEDVLQFSTCIVELFYNSKIEEYVKVYMNYKNKSNI